MSTPDIQYFSESGTWHRPAGAIRIDALICPSGGGGSGGRDGETGVLQTWSRQASELGDTIEVEIGKGGRGAPGCGDGADGYALFVTHLALEPPYTEHVSYGQRVNVTQALADGAMIVCHGGGGSGGSGRPTSQAAGGRNPSAWGSSAGSSR